MKLVLGKPDGKELVLAERKGGGWQPNPNLAADMAAPVQLPPRASDPGAVVADHLAGCGCRGWDREGTAASGSTGSPASPLWHRLGFGEAGRGDDRARSVSPHPSIMRRLSAA